MDELTTNVVNLLDPRKPSPPTLDRLIRFLNTIGGTDKTLMVIQYFSKVLMWYYNRNGKSSVAVRIGNFSGPVSDFRILLRYYGLLPMIQWAKYIEQTPPASPLLKRLERIEVISNILYYPLEHIYWLGAHNVIPISQATVNKVGMWSCRFWALYVLVHFVHLAEEYRLLKIKGRRLTAKLAKDGESTEKPAGSSSGVAVVTDPASIDARASLDEEYKALALNTVVNAAHLPLTVHWSLENSGFPDVGVGFFGTIAAAVQFYNTWKRA